MDIKGVLDLYIRGQLYVFPKGARIYPPPLLHTAYLYFSHTPGTRQSETRLVEGVRFQLIEGRTRPLLRQLETHDVSEDDPSEARLKELVLAKVEAVK